MDLYFLSVVLVQFVVLINATPNIVMFLTDDQDLVLNGLEPMPKVYFI